MAIPGISGVNLAGGAGATTTGGDSFTQALANAAQSAGGGNGSAQVLQQMVQGGVEVMGNLMMQLAGNVLSDGLEDDDG